MRIFPSKRQLAVIQIVSLLAFLGVWEGSVRLGWMPHVLVPPPSSLIGAFIREYQLGLWTANVLHSLHHYAWGVIVGSVLGIALGVSSALWPQVEAAQEGIARLLRPIPPLAWIPFAIIWFGISELAAAFIIGVGVFWFNYFASITAVKSVDQGYYELAQAFGQGGFFSRVRKISLPGAAPGLLSGIRAGLGMGWVTLLAAELFGVNGIGHRMTEASGLLATDVVVLYMATIALLYTLSDIFVVLVTRLVLRWQE